MVVPRIGRDRAIATQPRRGAVDSVAMNDPQQYEFARPPMSMARFRIYLGASALIGGLLTTAVGMALGNDGETVMFVGASLAFGGAARLLWGLVRVSYDD